MKTGAFPSATGDHVNRRRDDNRWQNLREASITQQAGNTVRGAKGETGVRGVRKMGNKFQARLRTTDPKTGRGTLNHLGTFDNLEKAKAAYEAAARRYFGDRFASYDTQLEKSK
jgi:hypothetical protein